MTQDAAVDAGAIVKEAERIVDLKVDQIAEICHEVNRGLCLALGDTSQPRWADAPDWQKESARAGVVAIMTHDVTRPEDSHISWFTHKRSEGWVYGEKKDPVAKTHPCMVAFEKLPPEQQLKDYLFFTTVTVLAFR